MNYTLFVTSCCKNTKNSENIQRRNCKSVARTSPTTTTATTTAPPTATLTPTPTAPASPGICELRPAPPALTPKTPATNTENSGPRTPKLRLRLVARKEGFGNPKPSLHRTAPKPSLSISKSPIRGTRAEYLRRLPSRPHRPHWDPWRASAGNSNGRSGYPYPATRVRRPERPKRPHCRSAG